MKQSYGERMPQIPPIELAGLSFDELRRRIEDRRLPPVGDWDPKHCGHSRMSIARDGTWFHQGSPIRRSEMIRLFASILRREADGRHVLVTPFEKLDIDVEWTPLRAIEMQVEGRARDQRIAFRLDTQDVVIAGAAHPLSLVETATGPSPRLLVRNGLEAELTRPVYYQLADLALATTVSGEATGIWSDGMFFPLEPG